MRLIDCIGASTCAQVVDAASFEAALPRAVEAVFFVAQASDDEIHYARAVHTALLAEYGLEPTADDAPPLLLVDLDGGGDAPFAMPGKAWLDR